MGYINQNKKEAFSIKYMIVCLQHPCTHVEHGFARLIKKESLTLEQCKLMGRLHESYTRLNYDKIKTNSIKSHYKKTVTLSKYVYEMKAVFNLSLNIIIFGFRILLVLFP